MVLSFSKKLICIVEINNYKKINIIFVKNKNESQNFIFFACSLVKLDHELEKKQAENKMLKAKRKFKSHLIAGYLQCNPIQIQ